MRALDLQRGISAAVFDRYRYSNHVSVTTHESQLPFHLFSPSPSPSPHAHVHVCVQVNNILIWILILSAIISAVLQEWPDLALVGLLRGQHLL